MVVGDAAMFTRVISKRKKKTIMLVGLLRSHNISIHI